MIGAQPSSTVVVVPVLAIVRLPVVGAAGAPPAAVKPKGVPATVKDSCALSNDATPMTLSPTPGAPAANSASGELPPGPLLPIEATITTPLLTRRDVAWAVGYCGHWRAAPRLWLMTCMPSA